MIDQNGKQPRSNRGLSNDAFEYEKRGRLLRDDLARESVRQRTAQLLSAEARGHHSGIAAPRSQSGASGSGLLKGRSRETVLKVVTWTKSRRAPLAQAKYASHTRDGDDPRTALTMWNEKGEALEGTGIEREILSWDLAPESRNLSAVAKQLPEAERARLSVNERLAKRQAAHVIFSIPSDARSDGHRLGKAVDAALQETVAVAGFRYVYTIHTEHGSRPHAHVIIKAASEPFERNGREATRQLRLGPRELEAIRQVFTRQSQQQGLNVVATRREDRSQLRSDILAGRAPLRENMNLHQAVKQTRQGRNFERSAPDWYKEHGFAYERRRLAAVSVTRDLPRAKVTPLARSPTEPRSGIFGRLLSWGRSQSDVQSVSAEPADSLSPEAGRRAGFFQNFSNYRKGKVRVALDEIPAPAPADSRLTAHFSAANRDPVAAIDSFKAMALELQSRGRGVGLAVWAANNHAIAFGEPTGTEGPGLSRKDIARLTRQRTPQSDRADGDDNPSYVDRVARAGHLALEEGRRQATTERRALDVPPRVARSLERHVARIEKVTPTDPHAEEQAAHIRAIAHNSIVPYSRALNDSGGKQPATLNTDKARRYLEMHERIIRRDQTRGRETSREDHEHGGRGR